MLIPVRCFTCGKIVGNKWQKYKKYLDQGISEDNALTQIGLNRICCRTMILTHVDMCSKLIQHDRIETQEHLNICHSPHQTEDLIHQSTYSKSQE